MTDHRRPARRRRPQGIAAGGLVAVLFGALAGVFMALVPAPAFAHAQLVTTDPAEGSVVETAPEAITFTFDEPVRLTGQEVRVYDDQGQVVPSEATASGAEVRVALTDPAAMGDGTYVVGWYVVSADGHPISGSLSFSVGERSVDNLTAPPPPTSSASVTAAVGVLQGVVYVALLVAAGLVAFVVLVLPSRHPGERLRGRLRTLVRVAAGVAVVAALAQVPLASVYAQGQELSDLNAAFDATLVRNEMLSATLVLVGLGGVVALLGDARPGRGRGGALLALAALAAVAPSVVGHSRAYAPQALLIAADAVHLLAGAVWLGGLVGLVVSLVALSRREVLAAETLSRFSLLAGGLLLTVAATGTFMAWRVLGSWSALIETTYGRLLMVKVGIALVVAAVAALNRWRLLPRVRRSAGHGDRGEAARQVARAVRVEALLLVCLLGVTGFLVSSSPRPAPVEVPPGRTGVQSGTAGEVKVYAVMTPGRRGANTLRVQLQDESGEPVESELRPDVQLRGPDFDLGSVPLTSADAGTWEARVLLPSSGVWEVQVSVREDRFSNPVTTLRFSVE